MNYAYVILATVLLAVEFACSQKYQFLEGVSLPAGLRFNALSGLFRALIMWVLSGFQLEWSAFSLVLALGMSLCSTGYSLLGFQILKQGGMALYSTFLMCGGMLLPYIFGILFLDEPITTLRIIGVLVVLAAVILSNFSKQRINKKLLLLYMGVFTLNGLVSIISKCHQISSTHASVSSAAFVVYSGIGRFLLSALALLLCKSRNPIPAIKSRLSLWVIAGASVIGAVSYFLQLIGAKALPASVLYPIVTGGSIVFSAIAGSVFFKERITQRQLICIILCVIGTLLFL